ncbi:MAG: M20 family metallo-hydrolase [Bacteroidota bacterium]
MTIEHLVTDATELLKQLIATPSFSKEEAGTALLISQFFETHTIPYKTVGHNIYVQNKYYDIKKPTILLNSHHDTVKPNKGYTLDPFEPLVKDGKLYGLGSNDAGGCLVSLIAVFLHYYNEEHLSYNLVLAATAEEEISGVNGIELALPQLGAIAFGIVGEPTQMQMAVAERGLMVIDCTSTGRAGHAARNEGENALYKALDDVNWVRNYKFDKVSGLLGESRLTVTIIETENKQHNVVPATCKFVIDARVNELYAFDEILEILKANLTSDFKPRSTRMKSSSIKLDHPLVKAGIALGRTYYGSPTTSDKALMPFPALKIGPGDSARSHTADEFIFLDEIEKGIKLYIQLLDKVLIE